MDAKYLAEIRERCELGRPAQQREVKALLAEVERLTQENSSLEKEYRHYIRLSEKLDQQIVTLKKALQIVFTEFGRYLPHDMDYYIRQAQEQVGKIG